MINKVILLGNVGNVQTKVTNNGVSVANISLATNEVWRDKDGNKKTKTEWHNIVLFGRQAENVSKYLKKGDKVYIEGKIQTSSWEDRDGNRRYKTDIIVDAKGVIKFLGQSQSSKNSFTAETPETKGSKQEAGKVQKATESRSSAFDDDDVPF